MGGTTQSAATGREAVSDDFDNLDHYMLLCGSCNRAKSWACEGCFNWQSTKEPGTCRTCYWSGNEDFSHIGLNPHRRAELVWGENEVYIFEELKRQARTEGVELPEYMKRILGTKS